MASLNGAREDAIVVGLRGSRVVVVVIGFVPHTMDYNYGRWWMFGFA